MSKLMNAFLSRVVPDGVMRVVPGFEDDDRTGDETPFIISSSALDLSTAESSNNDQFMVPFDARIVGIIERTQAAPTTEVTLDIGRVGGSVDDILKDYGSGTSTGINDIALDATEVQDLTLDQGDIVEFHHGGENSANADGAAALALVIVPRN